MDIYDTAIDLDEDLFAAALNVLNHQAAERGGGREEIAARDEMRIKLRILDSSPEDVRSDGANDGFDFWQFRQAMCS